MLGRLGTSSPAPVATADTRTVAPGAWLLLRGLGRERGHWFEFPRLLEDALGVRTERLDLPGAGERRGEPAAPSVEAMARELSGMLAARKATQPWGVLGISLGGMVALSLAEQWPEGISHVVVINTSSRLSFGHQRLRPAACLALLRSALLRDTEARERRIYSLTTNAPCSDVERWARQAAELARRSPLRRGALLAQLLAAAAFRAPTRITQPALVLGGAADRVVDAACSSALARRLGAPHHCHPNAGHDLPLEDPRWVIEHIRSWLEATSRPGPR